jgi:thioredoxin-related protein
MGFAMSRFLRLAVIVGGLALSATAGAQDLIPWAADLQQAQKAAAEQRKLLLLHFYSDNCEPCVRVEQHVFSQPHVAQAIARNYVPVKIHAGNQPKLAEQFRVDRWPTDVICTPVGQEIMRTNSPQKPEQFVGLVDGVALQAGVGAARQWTTSMQAAGQQILDQQVAQAQAIASQATGNAQVAAGQVNGFVHGAAEQFNQQANQASQQWRQATEQTQAAASQWRAQAQSTTKQLGDAAQQTTSAVQNTARDLAFAWEQAARAPELALPATQVPLAAGGFTAPTSIYGPQAQQPPEQQQVAPPPSLPANNPWIGQQSAQQQPAQQQVAQQPAPQASQVLSTQPPPSAPASPSVASAVTPESPAAGELVPASQAPPIALEGYCPVTLLELRKWKKADPQFGAIHRNRTYLFATQMEQRKFLANPDAYSPVLSGFDPVIFAQRGEMVEGKRSYGLTYNRRIFLFADESSIKTFEQSPKSYADTVYQAMMQSEAGPKYR